MTTVVFVKKLVASEVWSWPWKRGQIGWKIMLIRKRRRFSSSQCHLHIWGERFLTRFIHRDVNLIACDAIYLVWNLVPLNSFPLYIWLRNRIIVLCHPNLEMHSLLLTSHLLLARYVCSYYVSIQCLETRHQSWQKQNTTHQLISTPFLTLPQLK